MSDTETLAALLYEAVQETHGGATAVLLSESKIATWLIARGVSVERAAPREPSEAAIEAAREASALTGELGKPDHLLSRRTTIGMLRAAYAVDSPSAGEIASAALRGALNLHLGLPINFPSIPGGSREGGAP